MSPINRILELLPGARQSEKGWQARCPAHEDRSPSLSIGQGDDGRVLLNCHAGCTPEEVCRAMNLTTADLFDASSRVPSMKPPQTSGETGFHRRRQESKPNNIYESRKAAIDAAGRYAGKLAETWDYHDSVGNVVLVVARFESASGKSFRPIHPSENGWHIKDPPGLLPLYGLSELVDSQCVYVVEGEKCVQASRSIGLVATTSAHGAKSAPKSDWSPLAGKDVVIIPDNDLQGERYAERVVDLLHALSPKPRVKIVKLPDLAEKEDLYDFLGKRDAVEPEVLKEVVEKLAEQARVMGRPRPKDEFLSFEPFPVSVLPSPICDFVAESSAAIGCDPSFVALPVLAVLATAIGNTHRIQLKRGWTEPAILWTVVVGESGTLKSPAFRLATKPLHDQQKVHLKDYQEELQIFALEYAQYEKDHGKWKRSKKDDIEPPEKPHAPRATRLVVSDVTVEALAPILLANPRGVLLSKDELSGWTGSFDRYAKGGGGADAAHWLSMHGGDPMVVDRKTGNSTIYVPRASVGVTGGIQPGILEKALVKEHRDSGLAARLLLSWPPRHAKRWTEAIVSSYIEEIYANVVEKLYALEPHPLCEGEFSPMRVTLSPSGKSAWIKFYDEHAAEQTELAGDLAAAWSKLEGYAARLALIVHMVRMVMEDSSLEQLYEVDATSVHAGVTLSRWFGREARRVYAMLDETDEKREQRQFAEWIHRKGGTVTVQKMQQGHRSLETSDATRAVLQGLVRSGLGEWRRPKSGVSGGRPREEFVLTSYASS